MIGVLIFTILTFVFALLIVLLKNFLIKETKVDKIEKLLPQYNCGACGYGSCAGMAKEIIKDIDSINKCKLCKNKTEVIKKIQRL